MTACEAVDTSFTYNSLPQDDSNLGDVQPNPADTVRFKTFILKTILGTLYTRQE